MMKKLLICIGLVLSLAGLYSCEDFSGQEVPSYIRVKGFRLVDNPEINFAQGEDFLTSEIIDVWVYVDNIYLGAYTLRDDSTFVIPLLAEGRHKIELRPGIKYNGMAQTREYYHFYTTAIDSIDLVPGKVKEIGIQNIMYNSASTASGSRVRPVFEKRWLFEESFNPFTNESTSTEASYMKIISNDSVAWGNNCGAFYSSSKSDDYKMLSKDSISSTNTNAMIMEIDYHANIPFEVGLYGKTSSASSMYYISAIRFLPNHTSGDDCGKKENWQKMYVILGKAWAQLNYNGFYLYFQPFNEDDLSNGFVHIDNIKIIHYPE